MENDNYSLKILVESVTQQKIQAIDRGGQNSFSDLCLFTSQQLQFKEKLKTFEENAVLLKGFYGLGKKQDKFRLTINQFAIIELDFDGLSAHEFAAG